MRRNTQRKPAPPALSLLTSMATPVAPSPRPLRIPLGLLGRLRQRIARMIAGDTAPAVLFRPAKHPKEVTPPGAMAMDEYPGLDSALSWAASSFGSAYAEGQIFLGYPVLAEMAQRPEYRRMCERIATEMTREWIDLKSKGTTDKTATIKTIADELERLHVRECFAEAAIQDGFFGRSHLYLYTGDTNNPQELSTSIGSGDDETSKAKIGPNKPLVRLKPVEAVWTYPLQYNTTDPLRPDWYKPTVWGVMAKNVHASRLLTFIGREVPDILKPAYSFGGVPLIQMAKPYVDNWLRTRQSVSDTVHSFSVSGIQTDMQSALAADGDELFNRVELFNLLRDNRGLMLLNKETEEFFQFNTPLGTLDALQAQAQEQMASMPGIPLVVFFGITPKGLNASSDGEIKVWHEWIRAYQQQLFAANLKRVIDFIMLSKFGAVDPDIIFEFRPLDSPDEKGEAEINKIEAETDVILIDAGVIHPEESRKRIGADPGSGHSGIDVDDVPEAPEEENGVGDLADPSGPHDQTTKDD